MERGLSYLTPSEFIHAWQSEEQEFVIRTSGSTGKPKPITITRNQMLVSIINTQKAFDLKQGDKALVCINTTYIGGMMMMARSLELGMKMTIVQPVANPFLEISLDKQFDFIALVPLQLEAILDSSHSHRLDNCKAIIIGGAAVNNLLMDKLQELTAPIYATYGMTETVSHIALKRLNGGGRESVFTAFDNVNLSQDERDCLVIGGSVTNHEKIRTNDKVELLNDKQFNLLGRVDNVINSGGVKIQIEALEDKIANVLRQNDLFVPFFITTKKDTKLGEKVVLCVEIIEDFDTDRILDLLNPSLGKFELPKEVVIFTKFERTETGKIKRQVL